MRCKKKASQHNKPTQEDKTCTNNIFNLWSTFANTDGSSSLITYFTLNKTLEEKRIPSFLKMQHQSRASGDEKQSVLIKDTSAGQSPTQWSSLLPLLRKEKLVVHPYLLSLSLSLERERLRRLDLRLRLLVTLLPEDEDEDEEEEDERRRCFLFFLLRLSSSLSDERRPMLAGCQLA